MTARFSILILGLAIAAAPFQALLGGGSQVPPPSSKEAKNTATQAAPESPAKASEPEAYTLEAWDFQDPAKFKSMIKDREELMLKMYNLRIKLISEDPELLKLHKQIMELHKELAMQLESKKDMKKLTDKLKELDADLEKLPRKDAK